MWNSKSSEPDPAQPLNAPVGDAAATTQMTGRPSGVQPVAAPATQAPPTPTGTGRSAAASARSSAPDQGPGVVRRTTNNVKRILLVVVGALVALFAVFNSQQVQVHWIFGDAVQSPLILVIAIAFVAGAIIGWIGAKLGRRNAAAPEGSQR